MRGVIIDIGGVLAQDRLLDTANRWARRLGLTPAEIVAAIYAGNDEAVLVGRISETTPEETLFVDDTVGHVEAAAGLGIRGHVHSLTADTIDAIHRFVRDG